MTCCSVMSLTFLLTCIRSNAFVSKLRKGNAKLLGECPRPGGFVATWTNMELQGRKTHVGHVGIRIKMTRVADSIARKDKRCFS